MQNKKRKGLCIPTSIEKSRLDLSSVQRKKFTWSREEMEEEAYEEFLRQQTLKSVKTEKRNYGSGEWSEGNRH